MNIFWPVLIVVLLALALPPALKAQSRNRFFIALILSFAGVVLPLFVFFFSGFLVPDWKGACHHGWLDCFIVGKLALSPLVLLATAALYSLDIFRVEMRTQRWLVIGVFLGAVTAWICFIFGLVCFGVDVWRPQVWLLVPFYIALWYSIRAWQLIRAAKYGWGTYFVTLVGSLPFWLASCWWSHKVFNSLPDKAPTCFIVTAAASGHPQCVGPLVEIDHNGSRRWANQQLVTFWELETRWQIFFPRSHAIFRQVYNRLGPVVAAKIKSPWLADAAYLVLKPVEWLASLCLKHNQPAS